MYKTYFDVMNNEYDYNTDCGDCESVNIEMCVCPCVHVREKRGGGGGEGGEALQRLQ